MFLLEADRFIVGMFSGVPLAESKDFSLFVLAPPRSLIQQISQSGARLAIMQAAPTHRDLHQNILPPALVWALGLGSCDQA